MVKFESSLGTKTANQGPGQQMREFVVPDESGVHSQYARNAPPVFDDATMQEFNARMQPQIPQRHEPSDIERQFEEAKRLKREGKERLSDGAKRRIEMLIGMTRLTRDFDVCGNPYRLKALSSAELREAFVAAAPYDGTVQYIFEMRKQILSRSLVVVAGLEIDQFLSSCDLQDRLEFLDALDHQLLVRIYNEYSLLANESKDKYTLKTDEEVKEVLDDLKKA